MTDTAVLADPRGMADAALTISLMEPLWWIPIEVRSRGKPDIITESDRLGRPLLPEPLGPPEVLPRPRPRPLPLPRPLPVDNEKGYKIGYTFHLQKKWFE